MYQKWYNTLIPSIAAEAIIPEEIKLLKTPNGIVRKNVNSYSKHFSISNNRRYNFVLKWTWDGYKLFSTVALCLYLLQGPWEQQMLAFAVLPLEPVVSLAL